MATFYSEPAAASWQGNYFARDAGPNDSPTWITETITLTAAQAVNGNIFNIIKLGADAIVLDGYLKTTGIDGHASATATIDLGFLSDSNGDGDTDVVDYWQDGFAIPNLGAALQEPLENDLDTVGPFVPAETVTSTGLNATGYFVSAKIVTAVATAAAGTITVGLLVARARGRSSAAE